MDYSYLYDLKKASLILGLSVSFLRNSIKNKSLIAKKIGKKMMIHSDELKRFSRDVSGLDTGVVIQADPLLRQWALSSSSCGAV